MIQAIVERLAGESASAKRWSVAMAAALLVLATRTHPGWLVLVAALPVLIAYAMVDAYYLGAERAYRRLYEQATHEPADRWDLRAPLLDLPFGTRLPDAVTDLSTRSPGEPPSQKEAWCRFIRTTTRGMGPTVLFFYLGLIIPMIGLLVLVLAGAIELEGTT